MIPYYKPIFTIKERREAAERLSKYGYYVQGVLFEKQEVEPQEKTQQPVPVFEVGKYYSRKDVYRIVKVPENQQGGNWDTGYTRFNDESYVFANVGVAGRINSLLF